MSSENKNKGNILFIIIIILLVILIGIGGVLVYRSYSDNDINNNNINDSVNENNKVDEDEDNNINDDSNDLEDESDKRELFQILYKNIYPTFYDLHDGFPELGYYYHNSNYRKVEDMDKNFKIYLVANFIYARNDEKKFNKYYGNAGYSIPVDVFKDTYKTLFGSELLETDIMDEYIDECPFYGLSDNKENVNITDMCGDGMRPSFLNEIVKYEKMIDSNEIHIYEVVAYAKNLGNPDTNSSDFVNLYSNEQLINLVVSEFELYEDELIDYKDKLPMYKYTFKYNNNGDDIENYDDYYFYSVEKVK